MRSPSLRLLFVALALLVTLTQCQATLEKRVRANPVEGCLEALLPDARLFPNDLATDRVFKVRNVWLFETELVIEDRYGRITVLNRSDLSPRWYFSSLPGTLEFAPAAGPLSICFLTKGMLYEIDRKTGDLMHAFKLNFLPSAAMAVSGSTAYGPALAAGEGNRTIITVNLANGLEGWGIATRGSVPTAPHFLQLATRAMLYFSTEKGEVFAFQAVSSDQPAPEPAWSRRVRGNVAGGVVVLEDAVLVGSEMGDLWAFNRVTGETTWVWYSGKAIVKSPWAAGDQVYVLNTEGFHALSRDEGKPLWTYPGQVDFVVRRDDAVYVRTEDGTVLALATASGDLLRSGRLPASAFIPANTKDGMMFVVTADGYLTAVGKKIN